MTFGQSVFRSFFHLSGIVIPLAYILFGKGAALVLSVILLVLVSFVELVRIIGHPEVPIVGRFLKEKEQKKPTGSLFFLIAALLVILLFSKRIAICSLLILCISDPLSSLIGRSVGKHPLAGKSIEGTAAFFLSSVIILGLSSVNFFGTLGAAVIATLTELLTPSFLDDNLTIPLVTGAAMTLLGA